MEFETITLNDVKYRGIWKETEKDGIKCWVFLFTTNLPYTKREEEYFTSDALYIVTVQVDRRGDGEENYRNIIIGFYSMEKGKYVPLNYFCSVKPVKY